MLLTFSGFFFTPTCCSGCSPDSHLIPCSPRWVHNVVWWLGGRLWSQCTWVQIPVQPLTGSVGKSLLSEAQFLHHQVGIIVAHTLQGSYEDSTTLQGTSYVKMLGMWQALGKWLFLSSLSIQSSPLLNTSTLVQITSTSCLDYQNWSPCYWLYHHQYVPNTGTEGIFYFFTF